MKGMALAVLSVLLLTSDFVFGAEIKSYAIVQQDASLRVRGKTIRLYGIYIPPTNRTCRRFERPVKCASRAALALDFKIGAYFVNCKPKARNRDGSLIARCYVKGEDLSAYLLERGWAMALPHAPFEYFALERIAERRGFGIWGFPVDRIVRPRDKHHE